MKKGKKLIIGNCNCCPHFKLEENKKPICLEKRYILVYDIDKKGVKSEHCGKEHKLNETQSLYDIPDDCPLEDEK